MRTLIIKELKSYFFSPVGHILIGFYLLINSLILIFFETNYNIIKSNFIDVNSFFEPPFSRAEALLDGIVTMKVENERCK